MQKNFKKNLIKIKSIIATIALSATISGCANFLTSSKEEKPKLIPYHAQDNVQQKSLSPLNASPNNKPAASDNDMVNKTLTQQDVTGVWQADINGVKCQISLPQTKLGAGYRVSLMLCPASMKSIKYWNINNNKLVFYNASGKIFAQLSPASSKLLIGKTTTKKELSLSR